MQESRFRTKTGRTDGYLLRTSLTVIERFSLLSKVRYLYMPVIPVEVAAALLTACIAYGYQQVGIAALVISGVTGSVFVYLVRINIQANERGEQLERRTEQLAALQVGLISTMLKTLSVRDRMTARHSAAVARYSRAVAEALGCAEDEV